MITIDALLDMVRTDAVERGGEPDNHYFSQPTGSYTETQQDEPDLEPINFTLELVRTPDGGYKWIE